MPLLRRLNGVRQMDRVGWRHRRRLTCRQVVKKYRCGSGPAKKRYKVIRVVGSPKAMALDSSEVDPRIKLEEQLWNGDLSRYGPCFLKSMGRNKCPTYSSIFCPLGSKSSPSRIPEDGRYGRTNNKSSSTRLTYNDEC
uniref:Ribosomal protein L15 n=1 Tax=Steinernema glaseri TaxID=37863 RepID=A0A1I7YVJ9_9BILA